MDKLQTEESSVFQRSDVILNNLGINWETLKDSDVLDIGAGDASLAQAADKVGQNVNVFSLDIERDNKWLGLPGDIKANTVQADAEQQLPFSDGSFDYILAHGSVGPLQMIDSVRVLRPGGELRIYPIGGQILEYWYISYYLDEIEGRGQDYVTRVIEDFDKQIYEADGWIPNEYIELREKALKALSPGQKTGVLNSMVERYQQITGIAYDFEIDDPGAKEPNGVMIYKK